MTFYLVPDFPVLKGVTFPVVRTPEWDSDVQIALSGRRSAFSRRLYPRYRYELTYTVLRTSTSFLEWQQLQAFYNLQNGRANLWVYTDPDDGSVTGQQFGLGDGVTTSFQLIRQQLGTSFGFVEPVYAVQTATIINAGSTMTSTQWSIGVSGIVNFSTAAPAASNTLTWTGTYGWYCRFDEDTNPFEKFLYNMYELKKLKFSSETF